MQSTDPMDEAGMKARIEDLSRRLAEAEAALASARDGRPAGDLPPPRGKRVSALAHDLNNALAAILMAVTLLRIKVTDEKGARILTLLGENAERGAGIVRELVALGHEK